jgi:hypothetical protein
MKKTVAAGATREATVVMDNKVGDMVTRDTEVNKVDRDTEINRVDKDMVGNNVDRDMVVDNKVVRDMADMVNKDTEVTEVQVDRDMADSKADGVNRVARDMEAIRADKDMEVSKADGANTKEVVNSAVMDNRNTADLASNMKANTVQTGTMAEVDIVKMKMNPACRDVTRADRKKIMTIMMKTKTIMVCRAGMERKKMNMMMTKMKMTTGK